MWGRSVERGLLALVPPLEGDTHHREEGHGRGGMEGEGGRGGTEGEGREEVREREVMAGERQGRGNKSGCDPMYIYNCTVLAQGMGVNVKDDTQCPVDVNPYEVHTNSNVGSHNIAIRGTLGWSKQQQGWSKQQQYCQYSPDAERQM